MFSNTDCFMSKKQLLGEILVESNVVCQEDINNVLKLQSKEKGYLGEHLIRLGYVDEKDIIRALVIQNNFPYIAVDQYNIGDDVKHLVSRETAISNHIMPLNRVGSILSVVMADPLDFAVHEKLKLLTNCQIVPFIATKSEIDSAIDRSYK